MKPRTNGNARDDDAAARSRLARAGRRRQPTRRTGTRERAGGRTGRGTRPCPRGRRPGATSEIHVRRRTVRAPRRRAARARGRRGSVGSASPRDGELQRADEDRRARSPAPTSATSGTSHASSPNPPLRGVASTPGPNCATSASLISCSRVAGRDAHADERLHPLGDRRVRLVERRLADRADELGLEIGRVRRLGGRCDRSAEQQRASAAATTAASASASRRRARCSIAARRRARSSSELTAPTNASTTRPSRSMTNVSGKPGHAVAGERVPGTVVHDRKREIEPLA